VLSLPVGPLELVAEKQGFKRTVRTGINMVAHLENVISQRNQPVSLKEVRTLRGRYQRCQTAQ
jgi:hypothetical protein